MARKGGNKKRCEKYKLGGHKERNKKLKQERHQKRMERFRKRREEGKCYQYDKDKYPKTTPSDGGKTDYQKWVSLMAKLNNELNKEAREEKLRLQKASKHPSASKT